MSKTYNQYFLNCPFCNTVNDVSMQVYLMEQDKTTDARKGKKCGNCKRTMTVTFTMKQGLQTIESLLIEHYKPQTHEQ